MSLVNTAEPRLELDSQGNLECAICLQTCVHPAKLPCGHVFCFLCIKGVAFQSQRCAMCRQDIPADYLNKPELVEFENNTIEAPNENGYQWYYEGRNGWWRYDIRSNIEIENAWQNGNTSTDMLLAGALYNIDFQNMVQQRSRHPSRKRKIKRDAVNIPVKGTAGLKCCTSGQSSSITATIPENNDSINDDGIATVVNQMQTLSIEDTSPQPDRDDPR